MRIPAEEILELIEELIEDGQAAGEKEARQDDLTARIRNTAYWSGYVAGLRVLASAIRTAKGAK